MFWHSLISAYIMQKCLHFILKDTSSIEIISLQVSKLKAVKTEKGKLNK